MMSLIRAAWPTIIWSMSRRSGRGSSAASCWARPLMIASGLLISCAAPAAISLSDATFRCCSVSSWASSSSRVTSASSSDRPTRLASAWARFTAAPAVFASVSSSPVSWADNCCSGLPGANTMPPTFRSSTVIGTV